MDLALFTIFITVTTAHFFALSRKKVRHTFNRMAFYIDKTTGAILGAFGLTLIHSAVFDGHK